LVKHQEQNPNNTVGYLSNRVIIINNTMKLNNYKLAIALVLCLVLMHTAQAQTNLVASSKELAKSFTSKDTLV